MKKLFRTMQKALSLVALSIGAFNGYAQTTDACGCHQVIPATKTLFTPADLTNAANRIICFASGSRGDIVIRGFRGTAASRYTFRNACDGTGKTTITGGPSYGIKVEDSQYINLSGTGSSQQYGIEVNQGHMGVTFEKRSTNFKIERLDIHHSGFAGIMAKTDPNCDRTLKYNRGDFFMRGVQILNNYVHETTGEGMYIGYHKFDGVTCSDGSVVYAHQLRGLDIIGNKVDLSGWDGIQVGCADSAVAIRNNTITNYGTAAHDTHWNGIQIGSGTVGDVSFNNINTGAGPGIILMGQGGNRISNNLIIKAGATMPNTNTVDVYGIYADDRYGMQNGGLYEIYNNTIAEPRQGGIKSANQLANHKIYNNVIVGATNATFASAWKGFNLGTDIPATYKDTSNNFVSKNLASAKFISGTYKLDTYSPLVNTGKNLFASGITKDFDGNNRPSGTDPFEIGAYEVPIAVSALSSNSVCAGKAFTVSYTTSRTFNSGNVFTAQLSNASGAFTAPVNIGSATATGAGNISAVIPAGTAAGTGYKIRVVSSSPTYQSTANTGSFAIVNTGCDNPSGQSFTITREYFPNISGDKVTNLKAHATFPASPALREEITQFEGPQNIADNYGTRIRGYVVAPVTGNYTFYISGNDNSELYVSSSTDPAAKTYACSVAVASPYLGWTSSASQESAPRYLVAGQWYYIEALHKEGVNSDHIEVAWKLPSGVIEGPIPGTRLSKWTGGSAREGEYLTNSSEVSIYPNPAARFIHVSNQNNEQHYKVQLLQMNGTLVKEINNCNGNTEINIADMEPGLYVVDIIDDEKTVRKKINVVR